MPSISVLVTCYNREDFIEEALRSVLNSSFTDFEIVVSDDASTDRSVSIIESIAKEDDRVKLFVNEKNLGDYPNRNKAAERAKGKYIKYLDSDDVIYPHALEAMYSSMELFPDAGFGISVNSGTKIPLPYLLSPREIFLDGYQGYCFFYRSPASAIIRREAFLEVGGFSGQRHIGDNELWMKLACVYPMVALYPDLVWVRIHNQRESNETGGFAEQMKIRAAYVKEFVQRPEVPLTDHERQEFLKPFKDGHWNTFKTKLLFKLSRL
jgi:glycosyltransferase involved in cell wall biosynthesis